MADEIERTYRWRRRRVVQTRVTWVGLVAVLLILLFEQLMRVYPMATGPRALAFIAVVVVPTLLVTLWRAGLLPPERVAVDGDGAEEAPEAR